jgi:hypothetical protein
MTSPDLQLLSYTPISSTIADKMNKEDVDDAILFIDTLDVNSDGGSTSFNQAIKKQNTKDCFWTQEDALRVMATNRNRYSKIKPGLHRQTQAYNKFNEMS